MKQLKELLYKECDHVPTEETLDQMLAETDFVMWMLDYAYEKLFLAEARHSLVSNGSAKERYGCKSTVEGTLSIVWRGADGSERNHTLLQRREDRRDQYSVVHRHGSAPEDRPLRRHDALRQWQRVRSGLHLCRRHECRARHRGRRRPLGRRLQPAGRMRAPQRRYRGSPLAPGRRLRRGRTQACAEITSTH